MMTFKELKKLVKLPLYKEQRVPTVKALEESGVSVVAEKILENHGSISVYQNGYVIYRAHKRVTVFSLRNCVHYKYDALEGAGHHIEEEEFDEYEWHIAKEYGCGAKVFNRLLHLHGIQYRANNQWVLYAKHQDKGYTANLVFRLHRSDGSAVEKLHTAWTHKGRKFLYHELKRRGILPMAEQEG